MSSKNTRRTHKRQKALERLKRQKRQKKPQGPLRVILRVAGPWQGVQQLADRLPPGYLIDGEDFVVPDGRRFGFQAMPADDYFPQIFRTACRRAPKEWELEEVDNYAMIAAIAGPGGSMPGAQQMLQAGTGLIRAGGAGMLVDNSAMTHGGSDWIELSEHRDDPGAVFYAFVNITRSGTDLVSHGMHVLGQRDGIVSCRTGLETALRILEDFLRMVCAEQPKLAQGQAFSDQQGNVFRLQEEPDRSPFQNHRLNNPYGRWRLNRKASV